MPAAMASAFHSKESLHGPSMERDGYMVMPSRGRASTLRGAVAPNVTSTPDGSRAPTPSALRNGSTTPESLQLALPKTRKAMPPGSTAARGDALKPAQADAPDAQERAERNMVVVGDAVKKTSEQPETLRQGSTDAAEAPTREKEIARSRPGTASGATADTPVTLTTDPALSSRPVTPDKAESEIADARAAGS